MRLIFSGTPETAVPSLARLMGSHHDVVAVLTRPDARVGRGRRVTRSPVAEVAAGAGIPVLQPASLRAADVVSELASYRPDACAVVAFGALVPEAALAVPRLGWINLHFSLLPAWRGAAPVQRAIWHGDDVTGATTFLIESGLDTGPVFGTMVEPLGPRDTSGDVLARLAESGAGLLAATMDGLETGELTAVPQPSDGVTLAPKITVDDARIDWAQPARQIDRQVRACTPAPGAWSMLQDARVKVFPVEVSDEPPQAPGVLAQVRRNTWLVGTGTSPVVLGEVQPAGRRRMPAADWFRGLAQAAGQVLS
jgi:methionyl-tRNA formyltransferase